MKQSYFTFGFAFSFLLCFIIMVWNTRKDIDDLGILLIYTLIISACFGLLGGSIAAVIGIVKRRIKSSSDLSTEIITTTTNNAERKHKAEEFPNNFFKAKHIKLFIMCLFLGALLLVGIVMLNKDQSDHFEYIKETQGDFEVDIEWPLSLQGLSNTKALQLAIVQTVFNSNNTDIYACIENYFEEEPKISLGDYGTEGSITVKYQMRINDLYVFKIHRYANYGGGTSMSIRLNDYYLYYDKNTNKALGINDIITNHTETLSIVNRHISLEEYASKATELPDNFILSASGITFIFPQYSIGFGYQGDVSISLTYDELKPVLTETFKDALNL